MKKILILFINCALITSITVPIMSCTGKSISNFSKKDLKAEEIVALQNVKHLFRTKLGEWWSKEALINVTQKPYLPSEFYSLHNKVKVDIKGLVLKNIDEMQKWKNLALFWNNFEQQINNIKQEIYNEYYQKYYNTKFWEQININLSNKTKFIADVVDFDAIFNPIPNSPKTDVTALLINSILIFNIEYKNKNYLTWRDSNYFIMTNKPTVILDNKDVKEWIHHKMKMNDHLLEHSFRILINISKDISSFKFKILKYLFNTSI